MRAERVGAVAGDERARRGRRWRRRCLALLASSSLTLSARVFTAIMTENRDLYYIFIMHVFRFKFYFNFNLPLDETAHKNDEKNENEHESGHEERVEEELPRIGTETCSERV